MKNQIIFLVAVVGLFQLVNSKCSSGFELDCFYDAFFGDDSSDESSSKDKDSMAGLASSISNLTKSIQNSLFDYGNSHVPVSLSKDVQANLNHIPSIVSNLNNLTKTVTNVYNELSKHKHTRRNDSELSEVNKHPSSSSNLQPPEKSSSKETSTEARSGEKNEIKKLKEENANLTNEISTLTGLMEKLTKRLDNVEMDKKKSADGMNSIPDPHPTVAEPTMVENVEKLGAVGRVNL